MQFDMYPNARQYSLHLVIVYWFPDPGYGNNVNDWGVTGGKILLKARRFKGLITL